MAYIALIVDLLEPYQSRISESHEVARLRVQDISADEPACQRAQVVWTNGMVGLSDAAMACFPALELIVCQGVGYDGVDVAAANRRGITVAAGHGVNSTTVADHAMALLLALLRRIPALDASVRDGQWLDVRRLQPILTGCRVGIVGFGRIGQLIARRAEGFDCTVRYHARHAVADTGFEYVDTACALADISDVLILCCPGGPATHHMIDAQVLAALGPDGVLVNVARGSVVDSDALFAALAERQIAGAALDVLEGEPDVPQRWRELDNVIFTPHTGGLSAVAFDEMMRQALASVKAHVCGDVVPGRVGD